MRPDTRYRMIVLGVALGVLVGIFSFLALVRVAADAHVDLDDLPAPVLDTLRRHVGEDAALVQVVRGPTPNTRTYRIVLELADGSTKRLGVAADGSLWPPPAKPSPVDCPDSSMGTEPCRSSSIT